MSTLTNAQRADLVTYANVFCDHEALVAYQQIRPFTLLTVEELQDRFRAGETVFELDCSASIIELYYLAGCKDPSGENFSGDGDSQTMLDHLGHYTNPIDAHPGALVVFGVGLPVEEQHVCMVTKQGKDPSLFSHGSAFSCIEIALSEEQKAHDGGTVFLNVGSLG